MTKKFEGTSIIKPGIKEFDFELGVEFVRLTIKKVEE